MEYPEAEQRVLLTGGCGFIGGNLVHYLIRDTNVSVMNIDALTYAGNELTVASVATDSRYQFIHGDIADGALMGKVFAEFKPTSVINLAAESHVDRSIDGPGAFVQTNVVGTFTMLQAALDYWRALDQADQENFRFLHVSTDEVYGTLGATGAFTESTPYAPNSPYSASKAASDHLVRAWHHTYGFPTLTTNCSNNYGPYQYPEKLIPLIIANAVAGEPLPIYGTGENIRDWLFVEDHCRALWRVVQAGRLGEIYNVGGNSEKTNLEVVDTICALLDEMLDDSPHKPHAALKHFVTDRPGHDWRYAIDASKLSRELDWRPQEDFSSGMRRTVQWYLDNQEWCDQISGNYAGQRLGTNKS